MAPSAEQAVRTFADRILTATRQTFALAGATFREAVRMKAFVAPLAFAATVAIASPFLPTDGTAQGAVRLAISTNLIAASVFAAISAVLLSSLVYARERADRTSFTVATKPVPHALLYVGRVLGLSAVLGVMIAAMAIATWGFTTYVAHRESARSEEDRRSVREIFEVRQSIDPVWQTGPVRAPDTGPDAGDSIEPGEAAQWSFRVPARGARYATYRARIHLDAVPQEIQVAGVSQEDGGVYEIPTVRPERGSGLELEVPREMVAIDQEARRRSGILTFAVRNVSPRTLTFSGTATAEVVAGAYRYLRGSRTYHWTFDLSPGSYSSPAFRLDVNRPQAQEVDVELSLTRVGGTSHRTKLRLGPRPYYVIPVPDDLVAGGGTVHGELVVVGDGSVAVSEDKSLTFAPRAGTYIGSIARWALLEFAKAVFLVLATCAGATFLTPPIPALLGGGFIAGGYLISFVISLVQTQDQALALSIVWAVLRALLPDFSSATATGLVYDGVSVPMALVGSVILGVVVLRGGVAAMLGAWLSHRREYGA